MEFSIVIDYERCNGCRICESVCSLVSSGVGGSSRSRISILRWQMKGVDIPVVCLHCEDPLCKNVCPVNAISKDEGTGVVSVDEEVCVGCKLCTYTCPVGAMTIDPVEGVAANCTQCEGDPECVKFCPSDAITYVREDKVSGVLKRSKVEKLLELISPKQSLQNSTNKQ